MELLIISQQYDPHAAAVRWALDMVGIKSILWDWDKFPEKSKLSISISNFTKFGSHLSNEFSDFENITTVWYRRRGSPGEHSQSHPADAKFIERECRIFLRNALKVKNLAKARWINPFQNADLANLKSYQLELAVKTGFTIPDTLITNDSSKIRHFFNKHNEQIIYKPFAQTGWIKNGTGFYTPTTTLQSQLLKDSLPFEMCPGIYQAKIPKLFELRVTVMGDKIFAAKLDSQRLGETIDWRVDIALQDMHVEPYELDENNRNKILTFFKELGIEFGCLDFIVNSNGALIFLEVNEGGQFLFIEALCPEIKLLSEFCQFICKETDISKAKSFSEISLENFDQTEQAKSCKEWDRHTTNLKMAKQLETEISI